jgi:hypothetical protein
MFRRPVLVALVPSFAMLVAVACGSSGGGPTGPVGAPPPRMGVVIVDPTSGPIGTLFTLSASGLEVGEAVAFEITFPGEGKAFPGAALTVPPEGTTTTTYRATTANQPGEYIVRLTGPPGTLAEGTFAVTDGPPVTSALPEPDTSLPGPSTSGKTATTSRSGRTTTTAKGGATTSSTVKGATTTSTTRRVTSTTATTKATTSTTR